VSPQRILSSVSASERPARCYRELSHQLLSAASRASPTRDFVRECLRNLGAFTASDRLQLWISQGTQRVAGWSYGPAEGRLAFCGAQHPAGEPPDEASQVLDSAAAFASRLALPLAFGSEGGWLILESRQSDFFPLCKQELYADIALTLGAAVAYQRVQAAQRERMKELSCLYQIARLSTSPASSAVEILEGIVNMLPPAWQYSGIAAARICVDEHEVKTDGFDRAVELLGAPIIIADTQRGIVEVAYTESELELDGSFLPEERHLIDAVAREIGRIWEQRCAEEDRQRLLEQIRHGHRLTTIGQLAAGVAHELNEPLGSILGFAQLGIKTPDLPEQLASDLSRIEAAALHSREIVRKLSLFARQAPAKREPLNLSRVVREGMFLIEPRCRKEGIELSLDLNDNLPDVVGDAGQLTQVLLNLVVNAIQAMSPGGALVVATEQGERGVRLRVSDDGVGIPAEVRARIFEPFYTTKDVGQGTGLGLSVVHGIVKAHGGEIDVSSELGQGTTFVVTLPMEAPHV
jgi:two-component system NtrC family sensor kinase